MCYYVPSVLWKKMKELVLMLSPVSYGIGVLSHSLSPLSLIVFLSPFKSSLKLFHSSLLTLEQKSFSLFEKGAAHQVPTTMMPCGPSRDQKNPKILPATPAFIS